MLKFSRKSGVYTAPTVKLSDSSGVRSGLPPTIDDDWLDDSLKSAGKPSAAQFAFTLALCVAPG